MCHDLDASCCIKETCTLCCLSSCRLYESLASVPCFVPRKYVYQGILSIRYKTKASDESLKPEHFGEL